MSGGQFLGHLYYALSLAVQFSVKVTGSMVTNHVIYMHRCCSCSYQTKCLELLIIFPILLADAWLVLDAGLLVLMLGNIIVCLTNPTDLCTSHCASIVLVVGVRQRSLTKAGKKFFFFSLGLRIPQ